LSLPGQSSLHNFYASVKFADPILATLMSEDVLEVALNSLANDKAPGQPAADRLRETAQQLPEALRRVLDSALTELGYS
jgi:hypothetical protein